jgi:hypothetical protein
MILLKMLDMCYSKNEDIVGYVALLINDEPEYANRGKWLTNNDFVVFHRVAIAENR